MGRIIEDLMTNSIGERNNHRVLEHLAVMREELKEFEEPNMFNDFLNKFIGDLLAKKLGGPRREMWWLMKRKKLGLIDKTEQPNSSVDEKEAQEVS